MRGQGATEGTEGPRVQAKPSLAWPHLAGLNIVERKAWLTLEPGLDTLPGREEEPLAQNTRSAQNRRDPFSS